MFVWLDGMGRQEVARLWGSSVLAWAMASSGSHHEPSCQVVSRVRVLYLWCFKIWCCVSYVVRAGVLGLDCGACGVRAMLHGFPCMCQTAHSPQNAR
mmetsp:Transcript_28535/g.44636  ORF Transcript_28535/g.44636 Transcript_28535/m.44636 type:complete len:97 (+) Transcript_28535:251-541(+)